MQKIIKDIAIVFGITSIIVLSLDRIVTFFVPSPDKPIDFLLLEELSMKIYELQDKESLGSTEKNELKKLLEQGELMKKQLRDEVAYVKKRNFLGSWLFVTIGFLCILLTLFIENFAISAGLILGGFLSTLIGCLVYYHLFPGIRSEVLSWLIILISEFVLVFYKLWIVLRRQKHA